MRRAVKVTRNIIITLKFHELKKLFDIFIGIKNVISISKIKNNIAINMKFVEKVIFF